MTPSHTYYYPPNTPQDPNKRPINTKKLDLTTDEKLLISFFLTPTVPAVIFSAFSLENIIIAGFIFVAAYVVAGAHLLVLGVPAFLLGKRFNAIQWWTCIIVAIIIGGVPIAILYGWGNFISFGLFGASGGLTFWLLWQFWIHTD